MTAPRGRLLTTKEAMQYLKCSRSYLSEHADEIGVVRQVGRNLYWELDLERWVQRDYCPPTLPEPAPTPRPVTLLSPRSGVNPIDGLPWGVLP